MNDQELIAQALRCLQVLEEHPATADDIIRIAAIPQATGLRILERLKNAGIISASSNGQFLLEQSLEDISPFTILDAVWESVLDPRMLRMLFGAPHGIQAERTVEAVAMAYSSNRYVSDGGLE